MGKPAPPELYGGQLWKQLAFPFCSCYIVFLDLNQWCRIHTPAENQGNIAMKERDGGGPIYTREQMLKVLERGRYTCMGQYAEVLGNQREVAYQRGRKAAYEDVAEQRMAPPENTEKSSDG